LDGPSVLESSQEISWRTSSSGLTFIPWILTASEVKMAPEQKKRSRPVPNASQRSKKRQKIEPVKNGETLQRRPVAVDALPWNEVQMPEMFDDAEGFFGLEEVEGVEIIRDGGTVQFVSYYSSGEGSG
jgi:hypothetical protein